MTRPLALLTVALGLGLSVGLSAHRLWQRAPEASLDAAAEEIRKRFLPGDVIVVEPPFYSGPRVRLGDLPLLTPNALHSEMLAGYARAHLLEVTGPGLRGRARALLEAKGKPAASRAWPRVRLSTFALPTPGTIRFDLRRDLEQVEVTARYPDGYEARCDRYDRDRWICPRDAGWNYVGRDYLDIGDEARACVWMHPVKRGGQLRIWLPPVTGEGLAIVGGFGFTRHGARSARAPIRVRLSSEAKEIFSRTHPVDHRWRPFRVVLPEGKQPRGLVLVLETENNGAAHFCGALTILEPPR